MDATMFVQSKTSRGYGFGIDEKKFAAELRALADRIDPPAPVRGTAHLHKVEIGHRVHMDEFLLTRMVVEFTETLPVERLTDDALATLAGLESRE